MRILNELNNQPLVSVIMLNYNGVALIERCLGSVLNSDYPNFEVLFVDNASTDQSVTFAKEKFGRDQRLRIVQYRENFGFAQGNDKAVREAKGEYLVFLNTDTEVTPPWINELVKVMESDRTVGSAQSKLLGLADREIFDGVGDVMDFYGGAFSLGHGEKDLGQYQTLREIFSARGAAFIVRRSIFEDVGMFDPKFVSFLEDIDLGWRIWLNGYRVVYVPKSVVYHLGGATLKKLNKVLVVRTDIRSRRNQVVMMIKNYDLKNIVKYVPVRIIVNMIIVSFISITNPIEATKVLKGYRDSIKLREIWVEHLRIQKYIRKVPDDVVMKHMLETKLALFLRYIVNIIVYGEEYAIRNYFFKQRRN